MFGDYAHVADPRVMKVGGWGSGGVEGGDIREKGRREGMLSDYHADVADPRVMKVGLQVVACVNV